ncbi:MAG: type II secretion system protein [Clostridiales bacterium]|jgi:type IV pilus assembly protein PilA|nr:type II secretion system protein [Clostridiales bacterium]
MKRIKKYKRGFTLVEMVIVIALVIILSLVILFEVVNYLTAAKGATLKMSEHNEEIAHATGDISANI